MLGKNVGACISPGIGYWNYTRLHQAVYVCLKKSHELEPRLGECALSQRVDVGDTHAP